MSIMSRLAGVVFLLIVVAALVLRLHLATSRSYVHDEGNTAIPLAELISFSGENRYLPIRAVNHPALPAYVVKASSIVFGRSPAGYRGLHVLLSICAVALAFRLTYQWYGGTAAGWAAALLAFNEYYLSISARATAHGPYLFLATAAIFAFSRFLATERAMYLYAAGASAAAAFYCKEHAVLLLPVFAVVLLHRRYRSWWRRPSLYVACAVFFLSIAPDMYWNMTTDPDDAHVTYGDRDAPPANYRSHLQRIGGVGLSPYPVMFYARSTVRDAYRLVTGSELDDNTPEYESMNPVLGVLLLGSVLIQTLRPAPRDDLRRFLLVLFWGVFGFFALIARGSPAGLDPVSWVWVDVTLIPAVILTGAHLAGASGKARVVTAATAAAALLYAACAVGLSGAA
jgi:4-amino-4-deoxy-L-arabinose transferase-like glycosyltransferase